MTEENFSSTDDVSTMLDEIKIKVKDNLSLMDDLRDVLYTKKLEPLNQLLKQASKKFKRGHLGNRFDDNLVKICIFIYLKGGRSLYDSLSLITSLPSPGDVLKNVYNMYPYISQSKVYTKELKSFLLSRNLPLKVGLCEDGTRAKKFIQYDKQTSSLIGLKPPLDAETGMPIESIFAIKKPSDVIENIKKFPIALFLEAIMAVPFERNTPAFPLAIFPTNNECKSSEVTKRWQFLIKELNREGIEVCFISTDGAPAFLGGMKIGTDFGTIFSYANYTFPFNFLTALPCVQDTTHLLNKLKNRLFDNLVQLWMGNNLATGSHLKNLVSDPKLSKLDHGLNLSDVLSSDKTKDKMSFRPTLKILQPYVRSSIKKIPNSVATEKYLELMSMIHDAFMKKDTSTEERVYKAFYVVSFFRRWRKYIQSEKDLSMENFISSNAWHSLEISAGFLLRLALIGKAYLITISESQKCEDFFRNLRSFSSSGLTNINFTIYEALMKINRILTLEMITNDLERVGINLKRSNSIYTEENNEQSPEDGVDKTILSAEDCERIITQASIDAEFDARDLGMSFGDSAEREFFPPVYQKNANQERQEIMEYNREFHGVYECEFDEIEAGETLEVQKLVKVGCNYFIDDDDSGCF